MKKRHAAPQRAFDHDRQPAPIANQPLPEAPEQEKARGQGVEKAPLRNEEREVEVLPLDVRRRRPRQKLTQAVDADETAGEEKGGNREAAAPGVKSQAQQSRAQETEREKRHPQRHSDLHEEGRDEIDTDRVVEPLAGEDRVLGPEESTAREELDVGPVQGEIAVVIGQEGKDPAVALEGQPQELARRDEQQRAQGGKVPRTGALAEGQAPTGSPAQNRGDRSGAQRDRADPGLQGTREHRDQRREQTRDADAHEGPRHQAHSFSTPGRESSTGDPRVNRHSPQL